MTQKWFQSEATSGVQSLTAGPFRCFAAAPQARARKRWLGTSPANHQGKAGIQASPPTPLFTQGGKAPNQEIKWRLCLGNAPCKVPFERGRAFSEINACWIATERASGSRCRFPMKGLKCIIVCVTSSVYVGLSSIVSDLSWILLHAPTRGCRK